LRILEKIARFGAIALAVLFICVSLFGIFGAWFVSRKASDIALKGFGVIEIGVGAVDAGVGRVDDLIATSRMEVRQAAETIKTVGAQAVSNSPVLNALADCITSVPRCHRVALLRSANAVRGKMECSHWPHATETGYFTRINCSAQSRKPRGLRLSNSLSSLLHRFARCRKRRPRKCGSALSPAWPRFPLRTRIGLREARDS
jgi:hypothetical protein